MFWNKAEREARKHAKHRKKIMYDRVYELHKRAEFLCYINDAYEEEYQGETCVKLEGYMASGAAGLSDVFTLFSCEGRKKAEIEMEELYVGNNSVEQLEAADKKVALYPKQQDVPYKAGDMLCKLMDGVEI